MPNSDISLFLGPCGSVGLIDLAKAPKITGCCPSSPSKKNPKTVSPPSIMELEPRQPWPAPFAASTKT